MKICVWKTGHEISDTVAQVVHESLPRSTLKSTSQVDERAIDEAEIHICYGILRGADQVFRLAEKSGKPWFNIDRGYWKPGHYDGYYRVSLRGTQQTIGLDKLEPDYDRWDELGIGFIKKLNVGTACLICPPTDYVSHFFGQWIPEIECTDLTPMIREKTCVRPLSYDLAHANKVCTFNSSVGWEALRQGISVFSDPTHSMVGYYQKLVDKPLHIDFNERHKLFAIMASLQLTPSEMRKGLLWPLLLKLLQTSTSDGTQEKPLQHMLQTIP